VTSTSSPAGPATGPTTGSTTGPTTGRRRRHPVRTATAGWLGLQAVLGVVLWVGIARSSLVRSWFELVPSHPAVTDSFGVPDIAVIVVGSAVGCAALLTDRRWAVLVVAFTAGAVVYPTVYLLGWLALGEATGTVGLAVMVAVALVNVWLLVQLWRSAP
jgi:hypothetical protein